MDYDRYERFFVMLEEQGEDFAMRRSTKCGGHIKIETGEGRGAIRIGVRNLRHFENEEYIYKLILFGTAKEKTIYSVVGTVNVNKIGNGETYFRFDPKRMDKHEHELADYSHVIVAAMSTKDENEPLHPVMKGVLDIPFYRKTEDAGERKESGEPERVCYNTYYNRYLAAQCYKINENKNIYDRVVPFKDDVTGAEWTKMSAQDVFPMVSPGGRRLAEKYRHYIFGKGENLYYLGVPGRFLREEQPEEGESGFLLWQPIIGAEEYNAMAEETPDEVRKQAYGYWIIAIDTETGDILEA